MKPRSSRITVWGSLWSLIFFLAAGIGSAQTVSPSTSENLENAGASARAFGMGSVYVAVSDDPSAFFWNPAGLSALSNPQLALHHDSYLAGTFQETLVYAFGAQSLGGLAFAINYVNWGTLDLRDDSGNSQGSFNDTDVGLNVGWGKELAKGFSAGLAFQGVQQKIVDSLYYDFAARAGLLWVPGENFQLGAAYSNLGTNVAGYSLAQSLQLGGAWRLKAGKSSGLLLTMEGNWQPQGVSLLQWGVEGNLDHAFMLRGGYELPFDGQITGGGTALSAGAGVRWGACSLDYAFVPYGSFGVSNHLSLSYDFPAPQPQVVQVPVTIIQKVVVQAPALTPAPTDSKSLVQLKFKIPADAASREGASLSASQLEEQIQAALQSIKSDPQNSKLWWKLGHLYFQTRQKDSALQCFDQVLRLNPDNPELKKWVESYRNAQP